jgi:pimeloyl-ACP methyl ester carboxylesterase
MHNSASVPLVLIHGFLGGAAQWKAQIEAFEDERPVFAFDLPGFALAASQEPCTSIGAFAEAVMGHLDSMGIERFALLGHSMGGMIAQEIASRWPDRVVKLILYGTGPLGRMPNRFEPLEVSLEKLRNDGVARSAERIIATWFVEGSEAVGYGQLTTIGAMADGAAAEAAILAMAGWDGRPNLGHMTMPCLIVWGDSDRSYRWPQIETLWNELPNASLAVLPSASHAAHLEKPAVFQIVVQDFLAA